MEPTELQRAFFAEIRKDPYAAMVSHIAAAMWAHGYEQAIQDHGLVEESKPYGERRAEAFSYLTECRENAEKLIALAEIGRRLGGTTLGP